MSSRSTVEELDKVIDVLLAGGGAKPVIVDEVLSELVDVAHELRLLPSPEFKARLRADLEEQASDLATTGTAKESDRDVVILPSLFGNAYGNYPIHRVNFAASFLLHAAAAALIVSSGMWVAQHQEQLQGVSTAVFTEPSPYVLPPAPDEAGGGGGGGDADKLSASKGAPPRFAREQITPPAVVIRAPEPRLSVEATVVGPPQLMFPQVGPTGDPLSAVLATPSNGTGTGGGIGTGTGGGVGSGYGPGVGPGRGGGYGGGVYRVGGGVSAPRAIYDPDPEYSEEARKAKYQGTVILWAVIGSDGRPRDLKIARSLGMGLDEKALETVRKWRFDPAMKDGHPVAVQVNIEVNFRLY